MGMPFALALSSTSTADEHDEERATPSADSVNRIYIQTIHVGGVGDDEEVGAASSNPIENSSSSSDRSSSGSSSSGNSDSSSSSLMGESVSDSVYNQNYDEQSDSSYSAWDQDDLFDDEDEEEEQARELDEHNSQNDEFDDEYEDEYDVDPKAGPSDSSDRSMIRVSGTGSDDSMRNDDTEASSVVFGSRRKSTTKLGSNDAIKFVETPHGKAGFVYQAPASTDNKDNGAPKKKGDASLQNSSIDVKQRITPVLTADGKVALLYRGAADSGSTGKYEPIRNFTNFDESKSVDVVTEEPIVATTVVEVTTVPTTTTTTTTVASHLDVIVPENTEENAILPNINRPLSEVLGIKKNQFTQFRIKDQVTQTTPLLNQEHVTPDSTSNRIPEMFDEGHNIDSMSNSNGVDDEQSQIMTPPRTSNYDNEEEDSDFDSSSFSDALSKTEVVNLAIIPAFDSDLAAIQEHEDRRAAEEAANNVDGGQYSRGHYRNRQNHRRNMEDLSAIHCVMQAMVAIAALATVLGMLGAYFKTRVLDQITIMHWWEMVGVRYWVGFSRRGGVIL